jgi:hypothetical protein
MTDYIKTFLDSCKDIDDLIDNHEKICLWVIDMQHDFIDEPFQDETLFFQGDKLDVKDGALNIINGPNKIVEIDCCQEERAEALSLLLNYGGPLNDFYISKNNGIPLNRIYSHKLNKFPFRGMKYKMEDSFLNEYEIDSDQVLKIKNNLDETKIVNDEKNEKYILERFNHFRLDGKMIFYGIIRWIFGNKKEE